MSPNEPNIKIPVDLTNPGQFFACCGLLELASRIDGQCEACFQQHRFVLYTTATNVLEKFFACEVAVDTSSVLVDADDDTSDEEGLAEDAERGRTYPMRLGNPFNLLLNWWNEKEPQEQKLKTWTAGMRVTDLLRGHYKKKKNRGKKGAPDKIERIYTPSTREHFADVYRKYPSDWLREAVAISAPAAFSYDSRLSRNNALDLGHFTPKTLSFSPAIDVLTLIGLQRFRPATLEVWSRNIYSTWSIRLPISIASAVVSGLIKSLIDQSYEFPVKPRDSQGRFKLFGHAQLLRKYHG